VTVRVTNIDVFEYYETKRLISSIALCTVTVSVSTYLIFIRNSEVKSNM
jgi:hypothetical protein